MKILMLGTGYASVSPNGKRSVETSIFLLSKHLAQLGHKVVVADRITDEPREQGTGAVFHHLSPSMLEGGNILTYLIKVLGFTLELPSVIKKYRDTDIIQSYGQFPAAMAVLCKQLYRMKASVFYVACSPYLVMPSTLSNWLFHTLIEKWVLRHADKVVVHTKSGIRSMAHRYHLNPNRIAEIPAGFDVSGVLKRQRANPPIVFYPAAVLPRKNQMTIIKAIPHVLREIPDCKFVFAGVLEDKEYCDLIYKTVSGMRLNGSVELLGAILREEVFKLYQRASLVVFPTTFEMQGIIMVEAMAFGLPVVASDISVIRDVAEEGSVVLVDPFRCKEWAKAIISVLQDKKLRDKLSRKGKKLALSKFSWSVIAESFEKEYENATKVQEQT